MDVRSGWRYTSDRTLAGGGVGPTAIGPRLFVFAHHASPGGPIYYQGKSYGIERRVVPPRTDLEFLCVKQYLPNWAPVYPGVVGAGVQPVVIGRGCWMIGDGAHSAGTKDGIRYLWGPPDDIKRWIFNGYVHIKAGYGSFQPNRRMMYVRFDQGGPGAGDSGCPVFLSTGEFLGPMLYDTGNPTVIGKTMPIGELVGPWMKLPELQPYLKPLVLKPKTTPILQ